MKRWFRSRQIYRMFYILGFVALVAGMLLSAAVGPVQAGFADDGAAKKKQPKAPIAFQETVIPPTDVPPTEVPPTDVPPTDVPPTEVPPTDVPPTEVPPTEVPPTDVPPTEVVPTEVLPTEVLPTEVLPTEVLPTEITPTEIPTEEPTSVPVLTGDVGFLQDDTAVCMVGGGELTAEVRVALEGGDSAILQTAWRVVEPADLRTPTYYGHVTVGNGDVVSVSGGWPGIRPTDTVVEIHLGAILLDPVTRDPISGGTGMDFYWYPYVCPVGAPATAVPTGVLPTEILPTEVLPTEVLPTEILPTEILPTEILPTEVLPTEVLPTEVLPTEITPTEVLPTEVLPTEMPTVMPTDVVPGTPDVGFVEGDTAVCMMAGGTVSATVQVSLPAGYDTAVLQTAWKVAEPMDLRTSEVYSYQNVSNGDSVVVEGQWPGIRSGDQVVEVHLGAILLDPTTMDPISDGTGIDYYWYPYVCPVGAPATEVVPTEVLPTEVLPTEVLPTEVLPTEVLPTEVLPTEVLPTEVVPTEVLPTEVLPTEVLPTEVLPTEVLPTEVLPTEVLPTEVLPTEVLPTEILPTELPTEMPTVMPTDVNPGTPDVGFVEGDTAVCMMAGGTVSATVQVSLPAGYDTAVLQTAWKVAEPMDLRTSEVYSYQNVSNGDTVVVEGQWPGIRSGDQVVEVHLGAILLDPTTMDPISDGVGMDYYWYPYVCPVGAPATEVVPTEVLPTEVLPTEVLPTEVLPTEVLPTEVLPTEVLPTEVLPTEVLPTEVLPTEVLPTEVLPTEVLPTEVIPTEVLPTEVLPTEVLPTEVLPTEMPTAMPTDVVPGTPDVGFVEGDTAICMMAGGTVSATVQVSLPAGYDTAVLQTAWKVAEPMDLRTSEVYSYQNVSNGDSVVVEGQWPGIRSGDQVVEVHLGAILLDPTTMNPISDGTGIDYYWYPYVCPVGAPSTEVVPTEVLPTEVLPTEVLPTEVVPTEVVPTEVVPTEVLPTEVLPTEVLPTEVLPTEVLPTEVLPTEILPTEEPTVMPTESIPVVTTPPSVSWWQTFWFRILTLLGLR